MNLKELLITFFIVTVLSGITLNVMACDDTYTDCTVEDDLTGC